MIFDSADGIAERFPAGAQRVVRRILDSGGRACLVGGSIRDSLSGLEVHDWDFATDLPPERIRGLFPRSVEVGARFGTILVIEPDGTYEVTTFRREADYADARRPDRVEFTSSLEEDLSRRDFTVNAIALDLGARRLVDPHGGIDDLRARLIRCVGRPEERFEEDALRLLRCIRIAGQIGFAIEDETYRAVIRCARSIRKIAAERIREELDRILEQDRPSVSLDRMYETGLLDSILPELAAAYGVSQNRHHAFDVFYHTLLAVDRAPKENRIVRLSALFHDLGKVETRREEIDGRVTFYNHQNWSARKADAIMRRLRYPTEERERVVHLVRHHMFHYDAEWSDAAVRRFVRGVGIVNLDDLFAARRADTLGNGLRRSADSPELGELRRRIEEIHARDAALSVRDLAIDGEDLMRELGIGPGPAIGRILSALLEEVIEEPARNDFEILLRRSREILPEVLASLPPRRGRGA